MQNQQAMLRLYQAMMEIKGDSLTLPLPRRLQLPVVKEFRQLLLSELQPIYDSYIEADATMGEFFGGAIDYIQTLESAKRYGEQAIRIGYMISKHQRLGGAIFTVSEPLEKMLADTGLKNNIPVKFFTPPHRVSYIEFCPAEHRETFRLSTYAGGGTNISEGCYLQEKKVDKLPLMTREAREALQLDPQQGARILDIGITVSPLNNQELAGVGTKIAIDTVDNFTLYIQDEAEPLADVLERHFEFYNQRALNSGAKNGIADRDLFKSRTTEIFSYLTKVLMYLYIEKKARYTVNEASELEERIQKVAEKKRSKLEKQLNRVYDRIVIGPKSYTPLAERIASQGAAKGTKRPHFRSGYFGIRWKGTGQAKLPELVRVDETIVNEQMLKDADAPTRRDYEIR
ncbi:hypothetical protein [Pseudomonas sp. S1(2024)]|uniref:hypothetical protein n=1 Tax=Pseudomonas sp. S1(2024) TaxID=3390191 RepID=UPI00397CD1C8